MTTPASREPVAREFRALCEWAAGLHLDALPRETLATAVLILGDNIAATLSAEHEPEVRGWAERALARGGPAQASLWRAGAPRVATIEAAVANGLAVTWDELDDGYTRTAIHPGALSQPAILAAAEADGADFATMLRAVIGAYEIGTRFARAWPGTLPRIHPHGVWNTVCAAAGVALVRGASADRLARVLNAAATMAAPGPYSHPIEGALVRNAWPAAGAWVGFFAWELTEVGIAGLDTGLVDVFETILGAPSKPAELSLELGRTWTIRDGYHKLYAACHHSHAAMEAIEAILAAHPRLRGGERVRRIVVEGSAMAMNFANAAPDTTLGAKFSIPHAVAGTLAYAAADPRVFATAGLHDARIAALRARVAMKQLAEVKPWPYDRPARVTLELDDGSTLVESCEAALGSPLRPLAPEQVIAKIERLAARSAPGLVRTVLDTRAALLAGLTPEASAAAWLRGCFEDAIAR